jgi:L-histidine N-alpha-methyltransferase
MSEQRATLRQPSIHLTTDRLSAVHAQLKTSNSPLGVSIMEIGRSASRVGEVVDGIRGTGDQPRHIRDGQQYVGAISTDHWQAATRDPKYRTLSFGIKTFPARWVQLKTNFSHPVHYISVGPGTGEKDKLILEHLLSLLAEGQTVVYVPIEISSEILDVALELILPAIDRKRIEVIPIRMDVTDDDSLQRLKDVLPTLTNGGRSLFSLLGNTLANFADDSEMLEKLSPLVKPHDYLLLELATVTSATSQTAHHAAMEYEGSDTFHKFAMGTLRDYTNCSFDNGRVICRGEVVRDAVQVITSFAPTTPMRIEFRTGGGFDLQADETIELYRSRKYPVTAQQKLTTGYTELDRAESLYSSRSAFGVATLLLKRNT